MALLHIFSRVKEEEKEEVTTTACGQSLDLVEESAKVQSFGQCIETQLINSLSVVEDGNCTHLWRRDDQIQIALGWVRLNPINSLLLNKLIWLMHWNIIKYNIKFLSPLVSFSPTCKIEVPERLTVCREALMRTGLDDRCVSIPVREATDADILLVHRSNRQFPHSVFIPLIKSEIFSYSCWYWYSYMHCAAPNSEEYLEEVKKTPYMTLEELVGFTAQYGDVYFHPVSSYHNFLIYWRARIELILNNAWDDLPSCGVVEHLSLRQAGCRSCSATGGQCNDRSCEERHGSGQVSVTG